MDVDDRSLPFKERAYEQYKDEMVRLKKVTRHMEQVDLDEIEEYRDLLSIDERKEVTILLSWGGSSDGYKVYLDSDGEAVEGFYFFADWFEYEEYKLSAEELDRVLAIYPVTSW
jgi:hypothetical protein